MEWPEAVVLCTLIVCTTTFCVAIGTRALNASWDFKWKCWRATRNNEVK